MTEPFRADGTLDDKAGYWHPLQGGAAFTLKEARWWRGGGRRPL